MIEPVTALGARPMVEIADLQFQGSTQPTIDPAKQQEFEAMLGTEEVVVAQADGATHGVNATVDNWVVQPGPAEAVPVPTIGEYVSEELQGFRQEWLELRANMNDAVNGGNLSLDQMMQMSMEMQHSSVMIQLLINQVTAVNQEISKLMRAS